MRPTIEYPRDPIYIVDSETAIMHPMIALTESCLSEPTMVHTRTHYGSLTYSSFSGISVYAVTGVRQNPSRLTESGRMWRMLAIFQTVAFIVILVTLCIFF
jgi:hypothetical protein